MLKAPYAVEVRAPATIANLGAGFDVLGMAVAEPYDTIQAELTDQPGVQIDQIVGDNGRLSLDPAKNTAGIAAQHVLNQLGTQYGVRMRITKGLPLESGMGSSAASAVGAAIAVNTLLGEPLRREDLLPACIEAEASVSGRHADNVGPALLGGIVLITGLTADSIYRLPVPTRLILALVTPHVSVPTAKARAVLPKEIALKTYVQQSAALALLVTAIHRGDIALMGQAMEGDIIVEPARELLMPGLRQVRETARAAGALGTIISGAGPTLCSVCDSAKTAQQVNEAVASVYRELNIAADASLTTPSLDGAVVHVIA